MTPIWMSVDKNTHFLPLYSIVTKHANQQNPLSATMKQKEKSEHCLNDTNHDYINEAHEMYNTDCS